MAELAASLIGIIAAGTRVALVLSTTASDIGSAGKEAQVMAREIRSFCTILRNITQTIDVVKDTNQVSHCADLVSEMTAVSQDMFTEILDLVEYLQKPSWSSQAGSRMKLAARIKWVINKPKITFLRTAIEAYKADFCLLLGSMQFAQSLEAPTLVSRRSSVAQAPQLNRASRVLSQNMEELALDYRSSLQELEAARNAWEENDENENEALEETLEEIDGGNIEDETTALTQNSELQGIIESLREEVSNLNSNTSSLYSTTASSIYSALSTHSNRLSLLIEDLPLDSSVAFQSLRRMSQRMSRLSAAYQPEALPPFQEVIPIDQRKIPASRRRTDSKVLREMQNWPGGVPPWGDVTLVEDLIQLLSRSIAVLNDGERNFTYLDWAKQTVEGAWSLPLHSRRQWLDRLYVTRLETATKRSTTRLRQFGTNRRPILSSETATKRSLVPLRQFGSNRPLSPSSVVPQSDSSSGFFKHLNVSRHDPCWKVLPIALKKYGISAPQEEYLLVLTWGDEERFVGPEERPLELFEQLESEGQAPIFMLRKMR
ncbi:hypothetical protein B0J13DRAFT_541197 [Dactylonectria estremocensis]|uniref:Ras-associating domain-containing protein n=1 Tax=Dactylonectria estremocensis TaxID=1079267 RepID=A0A9P9FG67_9HYPO|nr:hypothetical protein B0J13DRAFT_541197 [Dactylonectria estremocensis]